MNQAEQVIAKTRPAPAVMARLTYAIPMALLFLVLPFVVPPFQRILVAHGLIFGIAALGFNLLLGYTGLLSFGHSAFFGGAMYAAAFVVKYLNLASMEAFLLAGLAASLVIAAAFGFVCVRYTRIYFSILALALSQVLWGLAFKLYWITGGTDGLRVPTPTMLGGLVNTAGDKVTFLSFTYYYYVLAVFFIAVVLMWTIVDSPFGKALQAIRDNETRALFIGIRVRRYRWFAFIVSGMFAGLAGALFAPLNGLVTPDFLYWPFSGKIVFMTVLGGFKSFAGPILGAIAYTYMESYAVARTQYWQALLGVVLVVLVLVMPNGIIGLLNRFSRKPPEAS